MCSIAAPQSPSSRYPGRTPSSCEAGAGWALAFYEVWQEGWVTRSSGSMRYGVRPGAMVELLYALPGFAGAATLDLPHLGVVRITADPGATAPLD